MDKYDRQVRLWNETGQRKLSWSKVCLINANTLGCETLQNLVLPGVGKVVIVDGQTKVSDSDLASNFFIHEDASDVRVDQVVANVGLLNPDVTLQPEYRKLQQLVADPEFWHFDCVIVSGFLSDPLETQLNQILWNSNIAQVIISTVGFYGLVRMHFHEQTIIETHDNDLTDLRLDEPWPQLQEYVDSIDLDTLDEQSLAGVPYAVLLIKARQNARTPAEVRRFISSLGTGEEANMEQATNRAFMILKSSRKLPDSLKQLLESDSSDRESTTFKPESTTFDLFLTALRIFYKTHGVLPLSGVLPDMESDTEQYMTLVNLYRDKFTSDKAEIATIIETETGQKINDDELTTLVKNCRYMQVHRESEQVWPDSDNIIYLGFMSIRRFIQENGHYPCPEDRSELRTTAISLLCCAEKDFPEGLDKVLDEMCRTRGVKLHNIAAIIGAIAAQEVIKVVTKQYVTMEGVLVYDGINGSAKTIS